MVPLELLSTEIGLVVLGLILLGWGVLVPVRARRVQGVITSVALGAILAMTLHLYRGDTVLFGGIYHLDAWSTFFKTLFLIAGILVVLSSDLYARRFGRRTDEFYGLMVLALLGMTVMVTAGELLTLYVGMELMTISFYILAAYCVRDERSGEAGFEILNPGGGFISGHALRYKPCVCRDRQYSTCGDRRESPYPTGTGGRGAAYLGRIRL